MAPCSIAVLDEKWREFERLAESGAAMAAIVKLGEGLLLCDGRRNAALRATLIDNIRTRVDPRVLEMAAAESVAEWRRAMRILSIGTSYVWEELVHIITLRMSVALARSVLEAGGLEVSAIDVAQLDHELCAVARSNENSSRFASALATIRKNWGIPVEDRWSGLP